MSCDVSTMRSPGPMADFCAKCWPEVYGAPPPGEAPGFNDLVGVVSEGREFVGLCEGCGPGWFDSLGRRVEP